MREKVGEYKGIVIFVGEFAILNTMNIIKWMIWGKNKQTNLNDLRKQAL